jgi:MFS family permease
MAWSFASLLAVRLLMGFFEGPILPISQSLVAEDSPPERRGHNMGVMQNLGSALFGSFLAPIVLVALATAYGWRAAFFIAGVPGFLVAILVWRIVRDPTRSAPSGDFSPQCASVSALWGPRNMRLCMAISVLMVAWMVLGWVFLPQYYMRVRGMSAAEMSWQVSVLGLSAAGFSFVVPGLSDRFGRKAIMVAFCLVGLVVPLSVAYFGGSAYGLAFLVFLGWSASGTFPLFMAVIPSESLPAPFLATGLGLVMGIGEVLGGVMAPTLAGMAADREGLEAPLAIQAGCALFAGLLSLALKETAPRCIRKSALARATVIKEA